MSNENETPEGEVDPTLVVDTTEVTVPRKTRKAKPSEPDPEPSLDVTEVTPAEMPDGVEVDRYGFTITTL